MRAVWVMLVLVCSAFGGEREVWYGADGKVVRVIENGEKLEEKFVPSWERREADDEPRDGVIRWDRRTDYSRGGYSRVYPVYPRYGRGYYFGGYGKPGWHGRRHGGWHGHGYGWSRWGWGGVRIRVGD